MSKVSNWLYVTAVSLAVISCGGSDKKEAAYSGSKASLEGALPSSEFVLARYDNNMTLVVDTLQTVNNTFKLDFAIEEGNPEFVYVISGDDVVVPVLLEAGAEVKVDVDAEGNVKLEGSEASLKLIESQKEYFAVSGKLDSLAAQFDYAEMSKVFLEYYNTAIRYVMENSHSLTVIPVLYSSLPFGDQMVPVFQQETAPFLYNQIADSLAENYPDLKANSNFQQLQEQLNDTEDKIAYARQFYNDTVLMYNNACQQFPSSMLAKIFHFKTGEFFTTDEASREAPKVEF